MSKEILYKEEYEEANLKLILDQLDCRYQYNNKKFESVLTFKFKEGFKYKDEEQYLDILYEAKFNDSLIGTGELGFSIWLERSGTSTADVIISAINDVFGCINNVTIYKIIIY